MHLSSWHLDENTYQCLYHITQYPLVRTLHGLLYRQFLCFVLLLQDPSHDACLSSGASTRYVAHDCWPNLKYAPHHPCKCNNNLLHTQSCRVIFVHSQDSPTHVLPAHLTIHRTSSARANTHLHSAKWTGSSCWNRWANDQSTCCVNANGQTMLRYRDTWAWFECVAMDYTF